MKENVTTNISATRDENIDASGRKSRTEKEDRFFKIYDME